MSNPPRIRLDELFSRVGNAYSSVDVRHAIWRDGENWRNALTIIRFSERSLEEVKARHAALESRLGSILTENFAIILRALSLEEWEDLRVRLVVSNNVIVRSIPGFEQGVTFDTSQNISTQTGVVWPYHYLPEFKEWQVLEIRLGSTALGDKLAFLESQVRGAGFAGVYSTISSFLEMPFEGSDPSHFVVIAPTLARCHIDSLDLDTKELEVTTEMHSKLSNCQLIVLVKQNGNRPVQGRPLSFKKSISLDSTKRAQLEDDFRLIQSRVTLLNFTGEEELELVVMKEGTSLFDITEPPAKYSQKNVESRIRLAVLSKFYEQERTGKNASVDVAGWAKSWGVTKRDVEFALIYLVKKYLLQGENVAGTDVPTVMGITALGIETFERQAEQTIPSEVVPSPIPLPTQKPLPVSAGKPSSNRVFIVHGRNAAVKEELARMLEKLGLKPVILHEQPEKGRVLIEKLEDHSSGVDYAFVLLTPDDVGSSSGAKTDDLKPRARQNVIFEFGYLMGKLRRDRICCLYTGAVELPSDLEGIVYVPFRESVHEAYEKIVTELRAAGYRLKL